MPSAADLARLYADAVTVLRAVHDFDDWLGQFWHDRCPGPEIAGAHRSGPETEKAIVWHEDEDSVYGYLPDYEGCFCLPVAESLPDLPFAVRPLEPPAEQDIVISAAMREQLQPPGSY